MIRETYPTTNRHFDEAAGKMTPDALVELFYGDSNACAKEILKAHSQAVADMALDINREMNLGLDPEEIEFGAKTHDIGILRTNAPSIGCYGSEPYIRHGIIGGEMLRSVGAPEWAARIAERHTGAGLTVKDIEECDLPLPKDIVLYPETTLEKLICYADKFFSKRPGHLNERKTVEKVKTEMAKHGIGTMTRFEELHSLFSLNK